VSAAWVKRLHPTVPSTLLLAEGDVLARCRIADGLRAEGYRVHEASSADEAVAVLSTLPVHLLLLDKAIPGGAGSHGVLQAAHGCRPAPRVILASDEAGAAGASVIQKPIVLDELLALIRRLLDPAGTEAS
jgi:DNA-binding response OmpR family regulator